MPSDATYKDYIERITREAEDQKARRLQFLQDSQAQRTSKDLYALWVYTWRKQGGTVQQYPYPYAQPAHVAQGDTKLGVFSSGEPTFYGYGTPETAGQDIFDQPVDYSIINWSRWMPTKPTQIPAGYNRYSLNLLILPDFVDMPLSPDINDPRGDCGLGDTEVQTLRLSGDELVATSSEYYVQSYPDINKLVDNTAYMERLEDEFIQLVRSENLQLGETISSKPVTSSSFISKLRSLFTGA